MRLVTYRRVSLEEQAKTGHSLDAQRERMVAWCAAFDHEIVGEYEDAGVSGSVAPADRTGLSTALAKIALGEAEGIVVVSLDRLTRTARHAMDLLARADAEGWKVASIKEALDTSTASGRLVAGMFALLAQFERETIAERVSATLQSMKREGKRVGRYAPFGWRLVPTGLFKPNKKADGPPVEVCTLEEDEAERLVMGFVVVQKLFPAEYIADLVQRKFGPHPRSGEPWTASDVNSVRRAIQRAAE